MENLENTGNNVFVVVLNIEYHTRIMVLKALNRTANKKEAANKLGVTVRQIHRYINIFDIVSTGPRFKKKYAFKPSQKLFHASTELQNQYF